MSAMLAPPRQIDGATVIRYNTIDGRHRHTVNTSHYRDGQLQAAAAALAICEYAGDAGIYLFYCDADWNVVNDTWHASIEDAEHQVEFEYAGAAATLKNLDR